MSEKRVLSTDSYKGVRDFYPEEMAVFRYILEKMRLVAERFGYQEYNASILEPAELYRGKTSEEIVNEQTYTFKDRGDREITLRPEMTPTVARMVAGKRRELPLPIRWYSIPNLFRYEQPQHGRLREHWQLNCDLFGVSGVEAEIEIISLAYEIMKAFGFSDTDFIIRLNSRKIMNFIINDYLKLDKEIGRKIARIIDKKEKITGEEFKTMLTSAIGEKNDILLTLLESKNFDEFISHLPKNAELDLAVSEIQKVIERLDNLGIRNIKFDQTLMRGFDYYTGVVFEIFDNDPRNKRSLFGGGRYNDLLSIFGVEPLPAFGFGMGDVTIKDALEIRGLLPEYKNPAKIAICIAEDVGVPYANDIAQKLRSLGINAVLDITGRKVGDQIKSADKKKIPFIVCVGGEEVKSGTLKVKELASGVETVIADDKLAAFLEKNE